MTPHGWIGIDVAKDWLDVASVGVSDVARFANDPTGVAALVGTLHDHVPQLVVLEATGGYERLVVTALQEAGLAVAVVNPLQVRHFARSTGKLPKPMRWMPRCWPCSGSACSPNPGPGPIPPAKTWPRC